MLEKDFEKLVKKAMKKLPQHIQKKMDNVAIVVKEKPSKYELEETGIKIGGTLLGLYQGVPKTAWGRGFGMILPDKITIFQNSIEQMASSEEEIKELVTIVVWHEIAHHFGFNESQIRKLETKWKKR